MAKAMFSPMELSDLGAMVGVNAAAQSLIPERRLWGTYRPEHGYGNHRLRFVNPGDTTSPRYCETCTYVDQRR